MSEEGTARIYPNVMTTLGSNVMRLTETSDIFYNVELYLRNLIDQNGKLVRVGEPRMTEDGISEVLGLLNGMAHRSTHLSNYSERDVTNIIMGLNYELNKLFMVYGKSWKLPPVRRGIIVQTILFNIFTSLKRGMLEGERKFLKGSQQEIKTTVETNQEGSAGIMKFLNPFGGKR